VLPLDHLNFRNRFTAELVADPDTTNRRRQVGGALFSRVNPTPVSAPQTLAVASEVADLLGISEADCASADFSDVFAGNRIPVGADPFAMVYGGHQFGNWAGQLGDGRAIAIGEVIDVNGSHQTLQLKGPGPTPYSRTADGRAVLRSSIREFLCSEAMFHLGVPTTRALSLVATGDAVMRDMFYDGNPGAEPGAIVCRVAPSFVRFGNFQLPASRGEIDILRSLVEFTIRNDFPHLLGPEAGVEAEAEAEALAVSGVDPIQPIDASVIAQWFDEVCALTIDLVVHWMRVGFVHGVLNTDNMSILGLTIDFGPYGWLENFDPGWTPNTTDAQGRRYRYGAQPQVIHWNLVQLANALVPLFEDPAPLQTIIDSIGERHTAAFAAMMAARLGWETHRGDGDDSLIGDLWKVLTSSEIDQVIFFRSLSQVDTRAAGAGGVSDENLLQIFANAYYRPEEIVDDVAGGLTSWLRKWAARCGSTDLSDSDRISQMNGLNPKYVLRNYLAQEIIDAATGGNYAPISQMLEVLRHPYAEQPGNERFAERRPEWARHRAGCSMLSCSS
jgi:serine/tyrosine/threonine adenylyltransferase